MPTGGAFVFGPFRLDVQSRRLFRDGKTVLMKRHHIEILLALVSRAGQIVTKNELMDCAWQGAAVEPNNLVQGVSQVRKLLDPEHTDRYVATVHGDGYRFVEPVTHTSQTPENQPTLKLKDLLAPHRAFTEGRAALERFVRADVVSARAAFEQLVAVDHRDASAHVGLATACVMQFEATRVDETPDTASLDLALEHATTACQLQSNYGEAWATLGFVLARFERYEDAIAACRRSTQLEPDNWRHFLRLALVTWGEERIRAARNALRLLPSNAIAHLLVSMVFVSREALAEAEHEVDCAISSVTTKMAGSERLSAVAMYWLKGLLCLARGAVKEALEWFAREIAEESRDHLYSREICANAFYAIGVCQWREGNADAAGAAFDDAVRRVPRHVRARAGKAIVDRVDPALVSTVLQAVSAAEQSPASTEIAFARAAVMAAHGEVDAAASLLEDTIAAAPPGNSGWLLPIEPLLGVARERGPWLRVLAVLKARAV